MDSNHNPNPSTRMSNTASITVTANNPPTEENVTTTQSLATTLLTPGNPYHQSEEKGANPCPEYNDNTGTATSNPNETEVDLQHDYLPCLGPLGPEDFLPYRESEWHCSPIPYDEARHSTNPRRHLATCPSNEEGTRTGLTTRNSRSQPPKRGD